jgi:hypothetical protein
MKIVLFEDDQPTAQKIQSAIKRHVPSGSEVLTFTPAARDGNSRDITYEKRLATEIQSRGYGGATLWVTDRDLSKTSGYRGLSETNVSKAAAQLGIPICKYARGASDDDVFERQRSWGDAQIVLKSSDVSELGSKVAILAKGFLSIATKLDALTTGSADGLSTPAEMMARILGHPESADQIALYASGDQKMIAEILPFAATKKKLQELRKRLPSVLGYWLYDSILRFPGLLVNSVAAASYLDIAVSHFERATVQKLFKVASYSGPFGDPKDPHWWRRNLDEVLGKAKTGNEFVAQKLKERVAHCLDSKTGKRAGYYCMVTKVPVSDENSVGNISWFPPGADLARVRKDVYEQLGPWLGLFRPNE